MAGNNSAINIPMMLITTSNSTSVKPRAFDRRRRVVELDCTQETCKLEHSRAREPARRTTNGADVFLKDM